MKNSFILMGFFFKKKKFAYGYVCGISLYLDYRMKLTDRSKLKNEFYPCINIYATFDCMSVKTGEVCCL